MFKKAVTTITLATLVGLSSSDSYAKNYAYYNIIAGLAQNDISPVHVGTGFGCGIEIGIPNVYMGFNFNILLEPNNTSRGVNIFLEKKFEDLAAKVGVGNNIINFKSENFPTYRPAALATYIQYEITKTISKDKRIGIIYQRNFTSKIGYDANRLDKLGYSKDKFSLEIEKKFGRTIEGFEK